MNEYLAIIIMYYCRKKPNMGSYIACVYENYSRISVLSVRATVWWELGVWGCSVVTRLIRRGTPYIRHKMSLADKHEPTKTLH